MPRCSSCRYWTMKMRRNGDEWWGSCAMAESENGEPQYADTLMYAEDYAVFFLAAGVLTHQNFGCVMHRDIAVASVEPEKSAERRKKYL